MSTLQGIAMKLPQQNKLNVFTTYLMNCRNNRRIRISPAERAYFIDVVATCLNVQINLNGDNPLSLMETLAAASALIIQSRKTRTQLLGISKGSLNSLEHRARNKLDASTKQELIKKVIAKKIVTLL